MHNERSSVETLVKEPHVGVDLELIRHLAVAIGKHVVSGDDGVAFNTDMLRHANIHSVRHYA